MKKLISLMTTSAVLLMNVEGAVTANLVITGAEGQDDPQSAGDGGLNSAYGRAQLNFIVKADTGEVKLDSLATNSSVPEVAAWGDQLDVLGLDSLEGSPVAFIPSIDTRVRVTINAVLPNGNDGRLKADSGRGFGVGGSNPHRVDWNVNNAVSEALRIEVDATELPSTHRVDIVSLLLGNAEGNAVARVVDFSNGRTVSSVVLETEDLEFELGSAAELAGGQTGAIFLSQAIKPEQGDDGFSLRGITLDIVPNYGDWGGYYWADELGNTNTKSLLGWVNVFGGNWIWSYNFSAWFYVASDWVTHQGSWAYMPVASEAALGEVAFVEPDWIWVYSQSRWVYQPASGITGAGSWIFIFDL